MKEQLRTRFWIESAMALASGLLAIVTVISKDWIEVVFRVDPDHSSGTLEWGIVFAAVALTVALGTLARREWTSRKALTA